MSALDPETRDVIALDDKALRELVRQLCEAELAAHGVTTAGVLASGHQNAPDGGIDVWTDAPTNAPLDYLPRLPVTFQAKATKMGKTEIAKEMAPKGVLRPSIADLGQRGGAYIIACGREDLTKPAYDERLAAMRKAFTAQAPAPLLDFYDASRLAAWARRHRGLAVWLLAAVGRPTGGWSPLQNWSAPEQGLEAPLLVDDRTRLTIGRTEDPVDIPEGLGFLRTVLHERGIVRLLGQSGMGKTRLVQALFDERVGASALPAAWVVYGDASDPHPEVSPLEMARRLVDRRDKAVLIVDNCTAATHSLLALEARRPEAVFSLLTVDFDMGDDQPEKTLVARLERPSDGLIEHLLRDRAPHLNIADIRRVAEFSEGNTRIALALAGTAEQSGSLARLDDKALIDRLFLRDRREHDEVMHQVARIGALVSAFYVEGEGDDLELTALAAMAEVSEGVFLAKLHDLLERGLAQQRGRQRAVLPQALAFHLAREALGQTTTTRLLKAVRAWPPRLFKSFTRRLGHLHDTPRAVEIAETLLAPDTALAQPAREDAYAIEMLTNLAPLVPRRALEVLKAYVDRHGVKATIIYTNQAVRQITQLTYSLAYEPDLFDEAATLLARLALGQDESRMLDHLRPRFIQFFQLARSATQATPAQRFALLDKLLASSDADERQLAFDGLVAALQTRPHRNDSPPTFGARSRTAGRTFTQDDVEPWFSAAIDRCLGMLTTPDAGKAKSVLAKAYVDLVLIDAAAPSLVAAMIKIGGERFWGQGWYAACAGLAQWKGDKQSQAMRDCEAALRPKSLTDRFDAFTGQRLWDWRNPDGEELRDFEDARRRARTVGAEAIQAGEDGVALIRRALSNKALEVGEFGEGLAVHGHLEETWELVLSLAQSIGPDDLNPFLIAGFLRGARQRAPQVAEAWMRAAPQTPLLAPLVPFLEAENGEASVEAIARIRDVVERGLADPWALERLIRLEPMLDVPMDDLARLIEALVDRGLPKVGYFILDNRRINTANAPWSEALRAAGLKILAAMPLTREAGGLSDYHFEQLARRVLPAPDGEAAIGRLFDNLLGPLLEDWNAYPDGLPGLMTVIAQTYPRLLLDRVLGDDFGHMADRVDHLVMGYDDDDNPGNFNVLSVIEPDVLLDWMAVDPVVRSARLMRVTPYFAATELGGPFGWTPLARRIMAATPATAEITDVLERRFSSGASSDEPGGRYKRRLAMAEELKAHADPTWQAWGVKAHEQLLSNFTFFTSGRSEPRFED